MPERTRAPHFESGLSRAVAATIAIVVTIGVAAAEFTVPLNYHPSIVTCVAVAACAWVRSRAFLWTIVATQVLFNYLGMVWGQPPIGYPAPLPVHWLIRTSIAGTLVVLGGFVDVWMRTQRHLVNARAVLEERAHALEGINRELLAREEEVARQNEELQSQSEELERQSEELRIANDDLAARERMLDQLLALSRTLATELTREQVMTTICETLTDLLGETADASAVLLRHGDALRVHCHAGFGPEGTREAQLPYQSSFAALVLTRGEAGFLEDTSLRPDLTFVQPRSGAAFQAVVGVPITARGRSIGALEAYCRQPARWTEQQISLLSSIAAQASISLETATLFEDLERERARFETVFRTLPLPVLVAEDPEGRQVAGNPAVAALFTTSLGANFSPIAPPRARVRRSVLRDGVAVPVEDLPLMRVLRTGEDVIGEELDILLPSSRRVSVIASAAAFYDGDGRISGGVCAFVDITARKALEHEIEARRRESEEASVRKTRFLAAVSHDIRTPANAIRLQAELIKRSADDPALILRVGALARQLQGNAIALVELVGEVLDLTRFDSEKIELQETEFPLGEVLLDECRQLEALAHARGLSVTCTPLERPLWLRTDRIKLARVLGNLIENAIKFTAAGGVDVTAARTDRGEAVLRVRDTGQGIPLADHERIFDEFFQLRNPERDRSKGRGLGLAICKRLVDAMGGTIRVESEGGRGSTFTVTLPADAIVPHAGGAMSVGEGTASAGAADLERPLVGVRVLLVEDHVDTRSATVALLEEAGAEVIEAADGAAALTALASGAPHLMLLDLMLPDIDGVEILKRLRAQRPESLQTVIVLSGDSASWRVEELERLGADAVMTKPIDPDLLVRRMALLVAGVAQSS